MNSLMQVLKKWFKLNDLGIPTQILVMEVSSDGPYDGGFW